MAERRSLSQLTDEERICLDRVGSYAYYHHLRSCMERNVCPFCNVDPRRNTILYQNGSFNVWKVTIPVKKNQEEHVLVVPRRHVRKLHKELEDNEWIAYGQACRWVFGNFPAIDQTGGMEATRFGNMLYNAGTIEHAHSNFKVPVLNTALDEPISKDVDNQRKNAERAAEFARRYEAGEQP